MHTTAPTQSATGEYQSPVQPSATKIVQVRISVAMVMPETGFEEDPIRPTMRDETVTKKNPKTTTRIDATKLPCVGMPGRDDEEERQQDGPDENDRHRHVALGPRRATRRRPWPRSPSRSRGTTTRWSGWFARA